MGFWVLVPGVGMGGGGVAATGYTRYRPRQVAGDPYRPQAGPHSVPYRPQGPPGDTPYRPENPQLT